MKPSELSQELKRIASAIEHSKNPSRELVMKDLRGIVASLSGPSTEEDMIKYLGKSEPKEGWVLRDGKEIPKGFFIREYGDSVIMQGPIDQAVKWDKSKKSWMKY